MYPYERSNSRKNIVSTRFFWEYLFSRSDPSNVEDVLKLLSDFLYNDDVDYDTVADLIPKEYSYNRSFGFVYLG